MTQANVDDKLKSDNPAIRRLLGVEGDFGKGLGLTNDWAYRIVKAVGNYGESFERNVGQGSPIKIRRGLNALWNQGRPAIRPADKVIGAGDGVSAPPRRWYWSSGLKG